MCLARVKGAPHVDAGILVNVCVCVIILPEIYLFYSKGGNS